MNEIELLAAAIVVGDPAKRAAFLDRECRNKPELRARLEALLAEHFRLNPLPDQSQVTVDSPNNAAEPAGMPSPETAGTVIAGKYKLLQQIGEGGMGTVWMADQSEPVKRRVALKLIRVERGQSKHILSRFEAERQAIALMDHPHIARLLDAGATPSGQPFFVMELVKGVPLTEYCDTHKLGIAQRLDLFMQICAAVQHAHQKGIIHRDLKPSNILVEAHDGKPVPKVIDFGLAKATSGLQLTEHTLFTAFGAVIGTPLYMAPEQATFNAVDVDTRADIYALGVILYELLTGTTPISRETFKKAALDEMLKLIREQEPPAPSRRLSSSESAPSVAANRQMDPVRLGRFVKGELDWIVLKALAKERERRYETPNGLALDIERFLNYEPVTAGPPTAAYRLRKYVQRNRGQIIAASAVLFALVGGLIAMTVGLVEARRQTEIAETKRKEAEQQLGYAKNAVVILGSVIHGIDPVWDYASVAEMRNAMRENLVRAMQVMEGATVGDPLQGAEVQITLGDSLLSLGEHELAVKAFTKAVQSRQAKLGVDHPDTLASVDKLAMAYWSSGQPAKAISLYEEMLKIRKAKLGSDHADTLWSMNALAFTYSQNGQRAKAISLYKESLENRKAKPDSDDHATIVTMIQLAVEVAKSGEIDNAKRQLEAAQEKMNAKFGSDRGLMDHLAWAYMESDQFAKAVPLYEELIEKTKYPDDPSTLRRMNNLAVAYRNLNRLDRSIPLLEDAVKRHEKQVGRRHPDTLHAVGNLGMNCLDAGRLPEAIRHLEESYAASRKYANLRVFGRALLDAYLQSGKATEAAKLRVQLVADFRQQFPENSMQLAQELAQVSRVLVQAKAFPEAEPLLRECLAIRQKHIPDHWHTFNTQSILGGSLLGQKKYAEAEPLLVKGYKGIKAHEEAIAKVGGEVRIPEALDRLIELYTAIEQPDEAKKWQAERAKYPPAKTKAPEKK